MNTSIPYIELPFKNSTTHVIRTQSLSDEHVSGFTHCLYDNRNITTKQADFTVKVQALSLERESISDKSTLWLNFQTKAVAFRGMSRAEKSQKQHKKFYEATRRFFNTLIDDNREHVTSSCGHKRTRKPTFYTCGLRLPKIRKFAEQAAALLILKDDKPYLYAVAVGQIQYTFFAQYDQVQHGAAFGHVTVEDYDFIGSEYELDDLDLHDELQEIKAISHNDSHSSATPEIKFFVNDVISSKATCPIEILRNSPSNHNIAKAFDHAIKNDCNIDTIREICHYAQIDFPKSALFRLTAFATKMRSSFAMKAA